MLSGMLGVESSSIGESKGVGKGNDIAAIAGLDSRVGKIRFAIKGMSLGEWGPESFTSRNLLNYPPFSPKLLIYPSPFQ
jgi:hypothetical protein